MGVIAKVIATFLRVEPSHAADVQTALSWT
jgi:hypothetical protein